MAKDRRAHAVCFGFDFQVNAAIVLMLENIIELNTLRLESENEDIELELSNGESILAQAKSVEKASTDFRNVRANLKKALVSLSDGARKSNAQGLIFITNSSNPLNDEVSKNLFIGQSYRGFDTLPDSSQKLILDYLSKIKSPLDTNKFSIQVLPFETDNDIERYKFVRRAVDDFVGDMDINIPGMAKKLLTIWQNEVFQNGSKSNVSIKLHKKDIVWPIIVIATDIERCNEEFIDQFDTGLYDEIVHQYSKLIDSCCERYEFFIKVLTDYNDFYSEKRPYEKCVEFALNKWKNYIDDLKVDGATEEIQRGIIQIVLYSIVRNRIIIDKVKREVKL